MNEPQWTNEKPTQPGGFWLLRPKDYPTQRVYPKIVSVICLHADERLYIEHYGFRHDVPVEEFGDHLWQGPIPDPPLPEGY